MNNLEEKLEIFLDEEQNRSQGFEITDKDKADWAVRKIGIYQSKIDEAKKLAEKRIMQISAWVTNEIEDNRNQIAYFESILRPFAEQELANSKKRSFSLPSGNIGFRKSQPTFTMDNENVSSKNEKLTKWVKENAKDYLVIEEKTDWDKFKKSLKITKEGKAVTTEGEIVPDIVVKENPESFYVKGGNK